MKLYIYIWMSLQGVVQVDLPFTALDACRELTLGQTLQLNCTSSTLTKAGE